MAKQRDQGFLFGQFAGCALVGSAITSVITGSFLPLAVVGLGLYLLFGFFTGVAQGRKAKGSRRLQSA